MTVPSVDERVEEMYRDLVDGIKRHQLVPLVGAGANMATRPEEFVWGGPPSEADRVKPGAQLFAPDGGELSTFLAKQLKKLQLTDPRDLAKAAQALLEEFDDLSLKNLLKDALDVDYPPTPVHTFLASIPQKLRDSGRAPNPFQLIITTNYDDVLERAFDAANNEPYDVIVYAPSGSEGASGSEGGSIFMHYPYKDIPRPIQVANTYVIPFNERTIIFKIHGTARPKPPEIPAPYVITEDDYIDFLGLGAADRMVPSGIMNKLVFGARLLFLGYSFRDWNLRVILRRVVKKGVSAKYYAINRKIDDVERKTWQTRQVVMHDMDLCKFIRTFEDRLNTSLGLK